MPELPEVEIAARNLRRWAAGRRIVEVEWDPRARRIFRPAAPATFARAVEGARLAAVDRLGKHLLLRLTRARAPVGVLAHLGMTGKWVRREGAEAAPSHSRARLRLEGGAVLHYQDPRLFGRLRVVAGARFEEVPELAALGPDPLAQGIDPARLAEGLARSRLPIKVRLLDQALLPGVGNIHASEACFRARIDPRRPARALSRSEARALGRAVLASFRMTLEAEDGPEITYVEEPGAENPFLVYAREGERCPRCGRAAIRRIVQAQRSTFFCPACQG
jgi:formamidopyrimidine-DNA glycosylase